MKLTWMIGGEQGSGVDTSANLFGKAVSSAGYYIFGNREYYSNIKGRHSYFELCFSDKKVNSITEKYDIIVSFDAETVFQHFKQAKNYFIYSETQKSKTIESVLSMEPETKQEILDFLNKNNIEHTIGGVVEYLNRNKINTISIDYEQIIRDIANELKININIAEKTINTIASSVSFALLGFDKKILLETLEKIFSKKQQLIEMNKLAVEKSFDLTKNVFNLKPIEKETRIQIDGNIAAALGKIAGGLEFQSYYPITPASDESVFIEENQIIENNVNNEKQTRSIVVVQTEDEISAIGMAIGSALTGVRSATATSGPGFALMAEGLSWAGQTESPVVVTYYLRGSPSTGLPTRSGQSDLKFAANIGHGEFPKIIIASSDHVETFKDAIWAFNLAEKYQTPVIHIIEKSIANTYSSIDKKDLDYSEIKISRGNLIHLTADNSGQYKRFDLSKGPISDRAALGETVSWYSGDEHNEIGHISENSTNRTIMYDKRMQKLELADKEIDENERLNVFGSDSDIAIITFGSPKGALLDIVDELNDMKIKVQIIQIRMFNPFPVKLLTNLLNDKKKIIDVENNYTAQLASFVKEFLHIEPTNYILKWNGRQMNTDELKDAIIRIIEKDEKKIILNSGV